MQVLQQVSLRPYNTFGMDVPADRLITVSDTAELATLSTDPTLPRPFHVLGGGSNVLLTHPVKGTVLLNRIKGIAVEKENEEHVWLHAGAGEVWHELVLHVIGRGWGGIENLALIPGTVGAAPIQNIGAYGVEVRNTIEQVEGWDWERQEFVTLRNADCAFGYRDSIFKHALKDKIFITAVVFRLDKKPVFHTSYGAIGQELEKMGVQDISIKAIAEAVISIRRSKLPDPLQIGNAGSFFKNPTIPEAQFRALAAQHPDLPSYPSTPGHIKVPAGWLIEQCGWKGYREGDAGVHARQALVLVNYGQAQGTDIWALSDKIVRSVQEKFGIELEREVQVW